MKVIFLDIDGVLNGHEWNEAAQSNPICQRCVEQFNRVLADTGAKIVLSSAWRYMVHGGAMTLKGFEYMLRTHGCVGVDIVGLTVKDEEIKERGDQIYNWIKAHPEVDRWLVLDDMNVGISPKNHVRTEEKEGLCYRTASHAIRLLNEITC